jgi:glycosyltransferase involved in cell wall biosynthesis
MAVLQERGYDVTLMCAPEGEEFGADLARFSPERVQFPRSIRPLAMARANTQFCERVRALEPDIVHVHTPAVALTVRLLPRRWLPSGTKLLYTVHGFAHVWDRPSSKGTLLERAERTLARRTDALLFQSQEDLEQVRLRGYRTRTFYLGNGVQDHWFTGARDSSTRAGGRAVFVGRLIREKGVIDLLDALEAAPDVQLRIAGTQLPSERDGVAAEVRARAEQGPLAGRVSLLGHVDGARMQAEHAASDFMVLPSYREGVPRSIIEGMASGLPAVVTDVRGCRELVRHGHNGLVVPPGDVAALAQAIQRMASLSLEEYRAMSQAAYDTASTRYRESFVYDRLVDIYSELGFPPPSAALGAA